MLFSVGLLTSCNTSNEKLIVGKWENDNPGHNSSPRWIEFRKDGYMVDSDHNTYTYKLSENDLIVERGGYSSVLRLDRLTKSELQFNSESFHRYGETNQDEDVYYTTTEYYETTDSVTVDDLYDY